MRSVKLFLCTLLAIGALEANAGNKIKYYFNHPVDNSVSTGTNAMNINGYIDDTLIAYINRAKYTLDICVYNFTSNSSASLNNVATAINAANSRGVHVRWIYNGTSATANSGLSLISSSIPKLASPSSSGYNIMHNKFVVIDANSTDPNDAIVWTGSTNWSVQQFQYDYNNVVIVQDSALAHAYRAEFNLMWGDTGMTANSALSKFGSHKNDLGRHNFTIDGKQVELYFSPSDHTNNHINSTIQSADKDLYFGTYVITDNTDGNSIIAKKNAGVYVAGIMDSYSLTASGTEYPYLNTALGSSNLKVYNDVTYIYHHKYVIVDPSDACSDPTVLTGSHNWTSSADNENDENTLIIHDATAANIYYQAFRGDFQGLGGTLNTITGCTTGVAETNAVQDEPNIYPNPSNDRSFNVSLALANAQHVAITIADMQGRTTDLYNSDEQAGMFTSHFTAPAPGIYLVKVQVGNHTYNLKFISY